MKKFREFLNEELALGCFNIGRKQMPQIDNHEEFESYLNERKIVFSKVAIKTENIKPTQIEFNQEKVDKMPLENNPIIISNDYKVLDGHHRYFKHQQTNQPYINCMKVDLPINELLNFCNEYCDITK